VAAVPGVHQVEVVDAEPVRPVVPLSAIGLRPGAAPPVPGPAAGEQAGWTRGPRLADVTDGAVTVWRPSGTPDGEPGIALVRIGDAISAFRDACAHQGFSLERGLVDAEGCVLTCPWHGLKYQALTGESISMIDKRLRAYPARVDGDTLWLLLGD
jgi:nitrite reductase/ring-hydroxylating ferredoxin subunit